MKSAFIIILVLISGIKAEKFHEVSDDGPEDKNPTGGAPCQKDSDCGGSDGGICNLTTTNNITTGKCICYYDRADVDCTYHRKNGQLAGGLQFMCFLFIGGVGNFVLERTGAALGQLFLYIFLWLSVITALCSKGFLVEVVGLAWIGSCASLIWCIVDGAMILEGQILDGNGYLPYFPN